MLPHHHHEYPFGYDEDEIERLGVQHRVWAAESRRFLDRAGFREGDTIVDLGCGPGFTTLELARTVGPGGVVIAVDRDGEISIPLLRKRADAEGLSQIEARVAELAQLDLPPGSVDGVYGRWVLMYLPEGEVIPLVHRVVRWLKPGGTCALAEFCNYRHMRIHPPTEHLPTVAEALMGKVAEECGGNPEIGNVLPGLLHGAGLELELHVVVKAVRATTPEWRWPDTLFRDLVAALVDEGRLDRGVFDAFIQEWDDRSGDPAAVFFSSPLMEVVARRGGEGPRQFA